MAFINTDLRIRDIEAYERTGKKSQVCRTFNIASTTLGHWKHDLILDNASFHKDGRIEDFAKSHGHVLIYLPPYSPERNTIEKCWAVLNQKIRRL